MIEKRGLTMDEILAAFDATNSNYERHSRAAKELAREYFDGEKLLGKMLEQVGFL